MLTYLLCQLIPFALCHPVTHSDIFFALWNFMPISLLFFPWKSECLDPEIQLHGVIASTCQKVGFVSLNSVDHLFGREWTPTLARWLVLSNLITPVICLAESSATNDTYIHESRIWNPVPLSANFIFFVCVWRMFKNGIQTILLVSFSYPQDGSISLRVMHFIQSLYSFCSLFNISYFYPVLEIYMVANFLTERKHGQDLPKHHFCSPREQGKLAEWPFNQAGGLGVQGSSGSMWVIWYRIPPYLGANAPAV